MSEVDKWMGVCMRGEQVGGEWMVPVGDDENLGRDGSSGDRRKQINLKIIDKGKLTRLPEHYTWGEGEEGICNGS